MVSLSFPKNDLEKINETLRPDLQKLRNQFLPKFKAVFEHQAQQPSKLLILHFAFHLNCNVGKMHISMEEIIFNICTNVAK